MPPATLKPPPGWTNWVVALNLLLLVAFASLAFRLAGPATLDRLNQAWLLQPLGLGWLLTWCLGTLALEGRPWRAIFLGCALTILAVVAIYIMMPWVPTLDAHLVSLYHSIGRIGDPPDIPSYTPHGEDPWVVSFLEVGRMAILVMAGASLRLAFLAWERWRERPAIDPVVAAILSRRPGGPGGAQSTPRRCRSG